MLRNGEIKLEEGGSHQCALVPYLVAAVVILICVSIILLCLCLYLYVKSRRVSPRSIKNESLSLALGDMCKINSFTFLELRKHNRCSQTVTPRLNGPSETNDNPVVFHKVKNKLEHPSSSSSGKFRRFEPELYKPISRLSVGMSNSISHSSYNSANEELEFDLYDYENENMVGEPEESYNRNSWQVEDFSMSELAPAKLFPSDDTIINIDDDILDTKVANTFGTPVVLRRGAYGRNQVESVTSDLTSSIMSELSMTSHISEKTLREEHWHNKNRVESMVMCYDDNKDAGLVDVRDKDLKMDQKNMNGYPNYMKKHNNSNEEKMDGMKFIDVDTALVDLNVKNDNYDKDDSSPDSWGNEMKTKRFSEVPDNSTNYYSFPPITLIDDLELWDD